MLPIGSMPHGMLPPTPLLPGGNDYPGMVLHERVGALTDQHQQYDPRSAAGSQIPYGSPSLPVLSPGRPGARNWVTFLRHRTACIDDGLSMAADGVEVEGVELVLGRVREVFDRTRGFKNEPGSTTWRGAAS